jgi:nucleoid DNA-binding protein
MPEEVRLPYLVREVSEELKVTQRDVKDVITLFFDIIAEELAEGNTVKVSPYLKFYFLVREPVKKGTMVMNPGLGEKVPSEGRPASISVKASTLSGLKNSVPGVTSKVGKELLGEKVAAKKARMARA